MKSRFSNVATIAQYCIFVFLYTNVILFTKASTKTFEENQSILNEIPKFNQPNVEDTIGQKRFVFISCSALLRGHEYKNVDPEDMKNSLFLFGSKQSWIFPKNEKQRKDSKNQPTNYLGMPEDLKNIIQEKIENGLAFFLKPDDLEYKGGDLNGDPKAYEKASAWLQTIVDPTTGNNYPGLNLDETWWQTEFPGGDFLEKRDGQEVVRLITRGTHDYCALKQLLQSSIPSLVPMQAAPEKKKINSRLMEMTENPKKEEDFDWPDWDNDEDWDLQAYKDWNLHNTKNF